MPKPTFEEQFKLMKRLIDIASSVVASTQALPFAVYTSLEEQRIANVPVTKPMLICVLSGSKEIGGLESKECAAGSFIFLSNKPSMDLRNIPKGACYFALLIDFDYDDFSDLPLSTQGAADYFCGELSNPLEQFLYQFIEWSSISPPALWPLRKRELLHLLFHLGYHQVANVVEPLSLSHKLHNIIGSNVSKEFPMQELTSKLAMSESTLRRRLQEEGTSLQEIKDKIRLGYGLHLLQTGNDSIGHIAELCGYYSQSRFTEKFKLRFGLTPSDLRKTLVPDPS